MGQTRLTRGGGAQYGRSDVEERELDLEQQLERANEISIRHKLEEGEVEHAILPCSPM